jgi:hypothetical protein
MSKNKIMTNIDSMFNHFGHSLFIDYKNRYVLAELQSYGNNQLNNLKSNLNIIKKIKGFKIDIFISEDHLKYYISSPTYGRDTIEFLLNDVISTYTLFTGKSDFENSIHTINFSKLKKVTKDELNVLSEINKEKKKINKMLKTYLITGHKANIKLKHLDLNKAPKIIISASDCFLAIKKVDLKDLKKFYTINNYHNTKELRMDQFVYTKEAVKSITLGDIEKLKELGFTFDNKCTIYSKLVATKVLTNLGD